MPTTPSKSIAKTVPRKAAARTPPSSRSNVAAGDAITRLKAAHADVEHAMHHVKEEEGALFPACRRLQQGALRPLGAAIAARKAGLLGEPKAEGAASSPRSRRGLPAQNGAAAA